MSAPDEVLSGVLSRRRFLVGAAVLSGAAALELTGCAGAVATPSPPRWVRVNITALTMNQPAWVDLPFATGAATPDPSSEAARPAPSASPPGASAPPPAGFGGAWLVLAPDGGVTAFDPRCTHQRCLYDWDRPRARFLCRCHSAEFGLDGAVLSGPAPKPLVRLRVRESGPGVVEVGWQDVPG